MPPDLFTDSARVKALDSTASPRTTTPMPVIPASYYRMIPRVDD
jgi:hypothetical protein